MTEEKTPEQPVEKFAITRTLLEATLTLISVGRFDVAAGQIHTLIEAVRNLPKIQEVASEAEPLELSEETPRFEESVG